MMHRRPTRSFSSLLMMAHSASRQLGQWLPVCVLFAASALIATPARAVPSYARQTGSECAACHVGSFGPQLTPYGIKFKLGGYTDKSGSDASLPLSAMVIGTYTNTKKDQDRADVDPHFSTNNNTVMQEASVFVAGALSEHVGSFSQVTYSGVDRKAALDNVDVRYAREATVGGISGVWGVTLNNNPTLQDPFNTLPAWRFPFTASDLAPSPEAAPLIDDGIAGSTMGLTAYTMTDSGIYAEAGFYKALGRSFLENVNIISASDPGQRLSGLAPYWRLAYARDLKKQAFSVGLVGLSGQLRDYGSTGPKDKYNDIGIDASYQFLGNRKNVFTAYASAMHEHQRLKAVFDAGDADSIGQNLNQFRLGGSYHFDQTYGISGTYFRTTGSHDATLWENGQPDSNGVILQTDWTPFGKENSWHAPWANLRLGLQYTAYNKFNGASANASDNNTLFGLAWISF